MKNLFLGLVLILALVACGTSEKTAWMDGQKVYDEYTLTIERQESFLKQQNSKKLILDSLKNNIIALENDLRVKDKPKQEKVDKYQQLVKLYRGQMDKFERESADLSNQYRNEILVKIQEKVKDYGKENGYTYILNQTSGSNILYGVKQYDVTDKIAAKLGIEISE